MLFPFGDFISPSTSTSPSGKPLSPSPLSLVLDLNLHHTSYIQYEDHTPLFPIWDLGIIPPLEEVYTPNLNLDNNNFIDLFFIPTSLVLVHYYLSQDIKVLYPFPTFHIPNKSIKMLNGDTTKHHPIVIGSTLLEIFSHLVFHSNE